MNKTNIKEGEMFVRVVLVKCNSHTRIKLKLELKCTDRMAKRNNLYGYPFGNPRSALQLQLQFYSCVALALN